WFGLVAAKTYLELHPRQSILVLEQDSSCGGTWSRDRVYPGLRSNNLCGSYEYPDFPMCEAVYGVRQGEHIPGEVLHRYLTDFAAAYGVLERTRFGMRVEVVEGRGEEGWDVHVSSAGMMEEEEKKKAEKGTLSPPTLRTSEVVLRTRRLIVATGLTSQPKMPRFAGQETFTAPLFHTKEFCRQSQTVQSCRRGVVVGAGKSAYDCAYALATSPTAGDAARVELVVRPTGHGPVWLCPAYVTPLKRKLEALLHTRLLTWFSPCPWGAEDGFGVLRRWLHGTAAGRLLTRGFWAALSADVVRARGYRQRHACAELRKLEPWRSAFWTGSALSIHNYARDVHDLVRRGRIGVHIADVARLRGQEVLLTDGTLFTDVDALVCATGWVKQCPVRFVGLDPDCRPGSLGALSAQERQMLVSEADASILASFPMLSSSRNNGNDDDDDIKTKDTTPPPHQPPPEPPLRNHRFIVPADGSHLSRRNLAYAGMLSTVSTPIVATVQALWISAFFDGKLQREPPPPDQLTREVMLHTQFSRWRYPSGRYGAEVPDLAFESLPYVDLLLNDLGVRTWRKRSWVRELVEAYEPRDYAGLVDEWVAMIDR
ncbi:hypothetical protein E4U55_000574, partial [Claviceps digitariae]